MRLYSRTGAAAVGDPVYGRFTPGADGGFDFPEELATKLHAFHDGGHPMWETAMERQQRLIAEESARRADPATLLAAVEQLVKAAQATTPAPEPVPADPEPVKAEAPKSAAKAAPAAKSTPAAGK